MLKDGDDYKGLVAEVEHLRSRVRDLELVKEAKEQLEKDVQQSREHLRLLITYTPAAVALFDREMRYLLVSNRWLSSYGLASRDVIGQSHYEVFPEVPERWKVIHRRCLAGASERCDEDPFPRADGRLDWVRWQVFPWHDRHGDIGGLMMFTEVITEQKGMQMRLLSQTAILRELSTPIIPISDELLALPLIGALDEQRSQQVTEQLLSRIVERRAKMAIIDVTGVPVVDAQAAHFLIKMAQAVRLLGAKALLTGIRPEVASSLVNLGVDISGIITLRDLQSAITFAMNAT